MFTPTETLTSKDIISASFANREFGADTSLMVARPGKLLGVFPLFYFVVPEGFYALVTRHGALEEFKDANGNKTPVWPAGIHLGPPWKKVSHLVTKQSMIFNTPVKGCKTKDNVTVEIDIALVLRVMGDSSRAGEDPWNVYKFVHSVTAHGLEQQLRDAQAEAIRTLARSVNHVEVFGLRSVSQSELLGIQRSALDGRGSALVPVIIPDAHDDDKEPLETVGEDEKEEEEDLVGEHDVLDSIEAAFNTETGASVTEAMKTRLNRQFKPQGVEILDVIIQQISLPTDIQNQMAGKTLVISQNAEQRMQHKYDLLSLNQEEGIKTLQQKHRDIKEELVKEGELVVLREKLKLQEEKSKTARVLAEIATETTVNVTKLTAQSHLRVQQIKDKTKLASEEIKEKSYCKAAELTVVAQAKVDEIRAKAELESTKLRAKGDKALFHAEGVSAPLVRTLNDHTTELKKYQAQTRLATNEKVIITGTTGGDAANRLILTEAALNGARMAVHTEDASAVLSQVAVASGNAQVRLNVSGGTNGTQTYPDE